MRTQNLGTAGVKVVADTSKYKRDIDEAKGVTETFGKGAVASIGKISAAFVALGGITGLAFAGVKMLEFGSDLQETQGKFDVVFRGMSATSEAWAKGLQDDYAMAQTESKKYLSSIQDLLVPTGLAREEAGKLSNAFVKMAADLGSFNNRETVEVVRDIQSALQGSSETMAKYGINVKAAKVEAEVFRMGLASTKGEITDAHKAQAIYNIMMREGSDAVGDMARTSDSYANQLKKAGANVTDLKTTIGEGLLPVASEMISDFNDWFKVNEDLIKQDLPKYIHEVTDSLNRFFKIIKEITSFMAKSQSEYDKMFENFVKWGLVMDPKKMEDFVKKFDDLAKANGPVLHAIDKTTEGFDRYNNKAKEAAGTNKAVADSSREVAKAYEEITIASYDLLKINLTDKERRMIIDPEEVKEVRDQLKKMADEKEKFAEDALDAAEKYAKENEKFLERAEESYQHTIDNIHDYAATTINEVLDKELKNEFDQFEELLNDTNSAITEQGQSQDFHGYGIDNEQREKVYRNKSKAA
ncbi:MAG: hypothetical protein KKC20_15885 [Proteobacteria bacterium]|nr:hypothetical protein [Pseudomonadota bacterium]